MYFSWFCYTVSSVLFCRPEFGNYLWIFTLGMENCCPRKVRCFLDGCTVSYNKC